MMKTRIIADSSVDIFELDGVDFLSAPLTISTDERDFVDDEKLDVDEMLDYLLAYKGRSYSACPNVDAWMSCYEGAEEIYVVALSSGLSGTYNAACTAAQLFTEKHPEAKVRVFDTKSAGAEVRLITEKLAELVRVGKGFEEICSRIDAYMRHTRIFFALESFHNFAQNGRVNKLVAKMGGLLGIRIMATGSPEGEIEIIGKHRGAQKTLKGFLECIREAGYNGGRIFIAQCKNSPFAEAISKAIKEIYAGAQIVIYETRGLCSYYAEKGGVLLACECEKAFC